MTFFRERKAIHFAAKPRGPLVREIIRSLRSTESAAVITTYFMAVGAVVTAPTLLTGLPPMTPGLVLALSGVVVTSVAGQWLLHHGLGFASATQGSLTAATSVLTAAGLEAALLGHHLPAQALLGACFMLGAIALAAHHS